MKNAKQTIKGMSKEAKRYYLGLMVKYGQITMVEAGIITLEEGLI